MVFNGESMNYYYLVYRIYILCGIDNIYRGYIYL